MPSLSVAISIAIRTIRSRAVGSAAPLDPQRQRPADRKRRQPGHTRLVSIIGARNSATNKCIADEREEQYRRQHSLAPTLS